MAQAVKVASTSDLAPGECKVVEAGGRTLALFNVNGTFFCLDNTCPHSGGPLGEGSLEGEVVTCPWHGWSFNVKDGACQLNPDIKQEAFPVTVQGGDLLIQL